MKEVLLKFETEEAYNKFMNDVVIKQLNDQKEFPDQTDDLSLEYDFENNIGIIKNNNK